MLMLGGKRASQRAARPSEQRGRQPAHLIPGIGRHRAEGGEERGARGTRGLLGPCKRLPKGSAMQGRCR